MHPINIKEDNQSCSAIIKNLVNVYLVVFIINCMQYQIGVDQHISLRVTEFNTINPKT